LPFYTAPVTSKTMPVSKKTLLSTRVMTGPVWFQEVSRARALPPRATGWRV